MKRIYWLLVALALLLSCAPALAEQSGTCGDGVTWSLDGSGTLTISGSGPMDSGEFWDASTQYIERIVIEDGVTGIGGSAFMNLDSLTSVTIPDSVVSIGDYAFALCASLTGISIPDSVTSIGMYAFAGCGLTSVSIPASVTSIPEGAFLSAALTSVIIPDGVVSIDNSAFNGCEGLTSVAIPGSVVTIGPFAFYGCTGLTRVTISSGVASIDEGAFACCGSLTSITIPVSVSAFGEYAFYECDSLTDLYFEGTRAQWSALSEGVNWGCEFQAHWLCRIGFSANGGDKTMENVEGWSGETVILPECGFTRAGWAFTEWNTEADGSSSAQTGAGVAYLPGDEYTLTDDIILYAQWEELLTFGTPDFTLPASVTAVEANAFEGAAMTVVFIPDGCAVIGAEAFKDCLNLSMIRLPKNCEIGEGAFDGCGALAAVFAPAGGTTEAWAAAEGVPFMALDE